MSLTRCKLAAPFPYFGGKVMQADMVWRHLGSVSNYIEPFAGSLGVVLNRPLPFVGAETINDANGHLVNFWRAVKLAPQELACHMDSPAATVDMHARHDALLAQDQSSIVLPVPKRLSTNHAPESADRSQRQ